jgi:hypothetical protein
MAKKKVAKTVKKAAPKKPAKKKTVEEKNKLIEANADKILDAVTSVADVLGPKNIGPEANNSGAPKNFVIRCGKCCWSRVSSGVAADLTDIYEIKPNCKGCGKWRKFRCPNCGTPATMKRIKGNA